jgi:hypothetical protein
LRDARTGPPTQAEREEYLKTMGWVANTSRAGDPRREFIIRVSDDVRFVGVTFFTTSEPMQVSFWPAGLKDDCAAVKVAQGFLPQTAQFTPSTWHRVQ